VHAQLSHDCEGLGLVRRGRIAASLVAREFVRLCRGAVV
jgi:hypothetical protein